jgi:hypothetical protein
MGSWHRVPVDDGGNIRRINIASARMIFRLDELGFKEETEVRAGFPSSVIHGRWQEQVHGCQVYFLGLVRNS